MRKLITTAALVFVSALFLCASQNRTLRVTAPTAGIHIEPFATSSVIGEVSQGDILQVFDTAGEQRNWYYISFYSQEKWATLTGFIEARFVEIVEAEPDEASKEKIEIPEKTPPPVPAKRPRPERKTKEVMPKTAGKAEGAPKREAASESPGALESAPLIEFPGRARVTSAEGAIRGADSDSSRVIRKLRSGEELSVTGVKGAWFRVRYPRRDGIILIGFIRRDAVVLTAGEIPQATEPEPPEVKEEEAEKAVPPPPGPPPELPGKTEEKEPGPAEFGDTRPSAASPARGLRMGFKIAGGAAMPSESAYGGGTAFAGALYLCFSDYLAVEVAGFRGSSEIDALPEGLSRGELSYTPLTLSLVGSYPLGRRLEPYALAGAGYSLLSFDPDQELVDIWRNVGFELDEGVDGTLMFQIGAGLDYRLSELISLNLDARYLILSSAGTWTLTDEFTGLEVTEELADLNFNTLVFTVGIKMSVNLF